jgi:cell division protease FtsH
MKNWARWTLLILWLVLLLATTTFWNPFASFPALLKYSVLSVFAAAVFGALVLIMQFYVLTTIIFPLPPRADSKAPKGFGRTFFPILYKKPPISPKAPTRLEEVIGNERAKVEIREVIDMMADPKRYEASGAEVPKGMLFIGPPGVGKTLFARAIANEIGIPFFVLEGGAISGLIFGLGAFKLKTIFGKLRKYKKSILFIDEIDSIAVRRQTDRGFGAVSDMTMTLNTLLTELDGFYGSNMMLIGATNNDVSLDPALLRPGRMDRRIYFESPTPEDRKQLFTYYLKKVKCDLPPPESAAPPAETTPPTAESPAPAPESTVASSETSAPATPDQSKAAADTDKKADADEPYINLDELVMLTANYSPAEIANVVNEAALIGSRPGNPGKVTTEMAIQALERISVGLDRTLVSSGVQLSSHDATVRLSDVVGIDDVKQDILEIVEFLRHGDELRRIGAKIPKGVLLIGPPGVGKTMLAKAMANEAGVPFYGLSGSYLGGAGYGAERIRGLYIQARKNPAAIVFIDEIDTIGGTVSDTGTYRTSALNQLLVELDGLGRSNVITIGATNMEPNLDPAFMRSGRFDRKAYIGVPDAEGRKLIFKQYLKNIKLASEPNLEKLAKESMNFSGADIAAAVNEAAIIAVRYGGKAVEEIDLEEAIERIAVTAGHKLNIGGMNLSKVPDIDVTLDDVKGIDSAKAEAAEVVGLLKNIDKVINSGFKAPKGVLLVGPPGTGKTMLAKAIANEAGVPFYSLSGGDFQSMWAGVGATRVRAVYEQARRSGKPCIVFIDEIDSIGGHRGQDWGGGAIQDSNKTLNQLLSELDGFGKHRVLTIGATNNAEMLDRALLRPGRFDRRIDVPLPNLEGREAILKHYLKNKTCDETVNVLDIARMTVFKAGAQLENVVNEAGLIALRDGKMIISQANLIQAIQRVMFGIPFSGKILADELLHTAYHEAGHAIVSYYKNKKELIQVLTIVPSGYALGYLWSVDKEDYHTRSKEEYLTEMEVSLGGYAAEELLMDSVSSGPSADLRNVGEVARRMIRNWGMGSFKFNIGSAYHGKAYDWNPLSAVAFGPSEESSKQIEQEIKALVDGCLNNVRDLLRTHRDGLDRLAQALIEKETLHFRDIAKILEPERSDIDVEREALAIAEKRTVGKELILNLEAIRALPPPARMSRRKKVELNGDGKNGSDPKSETEKETEEEKDKEKTDQPASETTSESDSSQDKTEKQ